jgi:PST family polysaccharide transporter
MTVTGPVSTDAAKLGHRGSFGKTAKIGAAWSVARQSLRSLLALPASMVLARLLAPADFGVGAAVNLVIQLSSRVGQLGLSAALVRLHHLEARHEHTAFVVSLGLGSIVFAILLLVADLAGAMVNSPEAARALPLAAGTFLIGPFGVVPSARLYRDMRFQEMATADLMDLLVGYLVTIACAMAGLGYWSFAWGGLAGNVLAVAYRIRRSNWWPSFAVDRAAWRDIASFGLGVQAKRILEFAGQNLDTLIVGQVMGMTALGFYDRSFSFMNTVANRLVIAPGVSFRIFSVIRDDRERFLRAYQRLATAILLGSVPTFAVLGIAAPEVFRVLFGERWLPAVPVFRVLTASAVLQILSSVTNPANEAAGHLWAQVWRQASFAVLIAGGVWVGSRFGITGAAVAVTCAGVARTTMMMAVLQRATGWSWTEMMRPVGPAALVGATLAALIAVTRVALWRMGAGDPAILAIEAFLSGLFGIGVLLWCPLRAVRTIVWEFVDDLAPARVKTLYARWARPVGPANADSAATDL